MSNPISNPKSQSDFRNKFNRRLLARIFIIFSSVIVAFVFAFAFGMTAVYMDAIDYAPAAMLLGLVIGGLACTRPARSFGFYLDRVDDEEKEETGEASNPLEKSLLFSLRQVLKEAQDAGVVAKPKSK